LLFLVPSSTEDSIRYSRQSRQHPTAAELAEFERPMPVMDNYDLLLSETGVVQ
jgi:hypothetical protein